MLNFFKNTKISDVSSPMNPNIRKLKKTTLNCIKIKLLRIGAHKKNLKVPGDKNKKTIETRTAAQTAAYFFSETC